MTEINRNYIMSKRISLNVSELLEAVHDLHATDEFINLTYREYDGKLYTHICKIVEVGSGYLAILRKPDSIDDVCQGVESLIQTIVKTSALVKFEKRDYTNDSTYDKYYTELWGQTEQLDNIDNFLSDL